MAEIKFNTLYDQMSGANQDFYDDTFTKYYNPDQAWTNQQNALTMKSLPDQSSPDFNAMRTAYDQGAQSKTLGKFNWGNLLGMGAADAAMPSDAERMAVERSGIMQGYQPNMRDVSGEYIDTGPDLSGVNLDDTSPAQIRFKSMDLPGQQKWTGTKNNPAFGFLDRNFNYRDLNKPDRMSFQEPSEAGLGYDRTGGFNFSGIPSALANMLNIRNPLSETSANYNPNLAGQIQDLRNIDYKDQFGKSRTGSWLGDQSSPYKITGGPLAGKNLVSGFGTNDYDEMLAKQANWFQKRKDEGKGFSQKNWNKIIAEQQARDIPDTKGVVRPGAGGQGDYQRAPINRPDPSFSPPSTTGHMGPGGKHYAQGGRAGYNRGDRVEYGLGGLGNWIKNKFGLGKKEGRAQSVSGSRAPQNPDVMRSKLLNYFQNKYSGEDDSGGSFRDQWTAPFVQAAQGGYMRSRYNKGGRVGILSIF